ncbi:MAG: ShlB/FhaC/HecB family hemolysin secretion/activation protein [Acetobacteraceae bacterium]
MGGNPCGRRRRGAAIRGFATTIPVVLSFVLPSAPLHAQAPPRPPVVELPPTGLARPAPGSPLPGIAPAPAPQLLPGLPRPPTPSAVDTTTGGTDHAITRLVVDGVTAFPPDTIALYAEGLTGPQVPENRIEAARRAIVDLYRSRGYVYTTVNAIIRGSELRFAVVEGYIAEVKLEGDVGPVATQVLRFLNHLVGQKPLSTAALERWLLLAQDIPGLTVRSTLNPSLGDPGVLTLIAQVSRRSVSGLVSADNRAFNLTGPAQGLIAFNFDSFTEFGERTQVSFFSSFNATNIFGQFTEEFFISGSGLKMRLYAGSGVATPTGALQTIGYDGTTRVFGGQVTYPLIRARDQNLNIAAIFDALESDISNTLGPGGSTMRGSFDSLRVLRLGGDYAVLDTLLGTDHSAVNAASMRVSQGLPILGASHNNNGPPPRPGEQVNFTKVSGEVSRTQTLFQLFDDSSVALRSAAGWQFSGNVLPPAEKFYLGGPRFNRGYYFGQVSGDSAVTLSVELQLNTPTPMPAFVPFETRSQVYAFYDWGKAFQNTPLDANVALQSFGGGLRLFVSDAAEIDLEGVYRVNRYPNGQGPGVSPLKTGAFYWQVLYRF